MAGVQRFEDLEVWKNARSLANLVYQMSNEGDFARDFGLKDQIRRAVVSVMSNIAEGFESRTKPRFIEYLGFAKASAAEVRCQLYIALDCSYLPQTHFDRAYKLADTVSRQLYRFMDYLSSGDNRVREDEPTYDV